MITFCPWGISAIESEPKLENWIKTWVQSEAIFLKPKDWYIRGHDIIGWSKSEEGFWIPKHKPGTYIWTPPPAAADACIEEIRKARMKRKDSLHIIIIQKLFTPLWLRQFNKIVDCHFLIPPIHPFWDSHNHENLIIGFVFPFLPFRPWQLRGTPKMLAVGRELSKMFKEKKLESGDILCKFLLECRTFPTLSPHVVWKMLYYGNTPPFSYSLPSDSWRRPQKRKRKGNTNGCGEAHECMERESKRSK